MGEFWWEDDHQENLWMEITRRPDVGGDLKAPIEARGGSSTPGYALLDLVQAGDLVIHYSSAEESLTGVSVATGERYNQPILWAARGSRARETHEKPSWKPGLYVAIAGYESLTPPVTYATIQARTQRILAVQEALKAKYRTPLYFPFTKYRSGVRVYQSYFAKFPRELLEVFPEVAKAVGAQDSKPLSRVPFLSDAEVARIDADRASGRKRSGKGGQGRRVDPLVRAAVEAHAMNSARTYFSQFGDVVDTSQGNPYDYEVTIGASVWHVEVKGTQSTGRSVLLSPNEVSHAREYPLVALYILTQVSVEVAEDGPLASAGIPIVLQPWDIDAGLLTATGYEWLSSD